MRNEEKVFKIKTKRRGGSERALRPNAVRLQPEAKKTNYVNNAITAKQSN